MHSHWRPFVAAVVVACLAAAPLAAAPSRALGSVVFADRARLGTALAQNGSTVFLGDQLATEKDGSLRVRMGSGQLYLLESSAASIAEIQGMLGADLERGAVGFASTAASPVAVRSGEMIVRAKAQVATHGQVQKINATEFVVSSYRGALEVNVGGEVYAVPEATSYRVTLDPEATQEPGRQDPAGVGARSAKRRAAMMLFLGAAISAVIITFVVLQNLSPERP